MWNDLQTIKYAAIATFAASVISATGVIYLILDKGPKYQPSIPRPRPTLDNEPLETNFPRPDAQYEFC